MSVVGFDIGAQACYVAVARHGGVEMANNEYSDRASPTIVGLGEKRREMGTSARNQLVMNPKSTIWGFKHLIGRSFSDPFIKRERQGLPYDVVETGRDGLGIKVPGGEAPQTYSPEQVMAMFLTYLKKVAESSLGKPVVDCVISVPSFYTDRQRRALLDASTIAGLTCLRLMNDTNAVALAYGIYKQDLPAENEKPRNVAFVDAGHTSLQVAICSFQKGKLKVLSKAFDPELGGRDFTQRLVTHFKQDFSKRYKLSSLDKPRPTLRLFNECEKLKKNLSANTTSIPINIDCLAEDKDVSGHMKREQFVEMCEDLLKRVRAPLEDALAKSGLKVEDIEAVEVVGGSCRVPAIKDIISDVFKRDLSTTLNMDEAVARGCALQCAMLSPTFKVRDFSIVDIQPYPIRLQWQTIMEGEDGEMVVFKEGDQIYHSKILSFYRKSSFELRASYQLPSLLPYPSPHVGTFSVKDVKPTESGEASKIKVKVRLSIHGIFFVKSASLIEKLPAGSEEAMETDKPATVAGNSTDSSDVSQGSEEQPPPPAAAPQTSQEEQPMDAAPGWQMRKVLTYCLP
ncbi:Heat shock 70 kDa protein 4 [Geodia barretti]|uniref:Heat shock 70 kDa protein 4 n=1 Tax=Geodia barretti TaxID=519541 RepID=A0AA35WUS6_GEOBA|nr:Heat shock 70 kDa protein 4 [Geodia barretti]